METNVQKFRRLHPGYDKQYYRLFIRRHPGYTKGRYAKDPRSRRAAAQAWNRRLKLEVLEAYGGACTCCQEAEPGFLTIDHISGGGRRERLAIYGNFYNYLKRNKWPKRYRLLCMNCNFAIGRYGICPHVDHKVLSRTTEVRLLRTGKIIKAVKRRSKILTRG